MGKLPNSILDCTQGKLGALDIATHFRMPHLEEASRKFDELREAGKFRISTEFLATHREYESLASRLVTPWIDEKLPSLAYESIDRIVSLAKSVLSPAYDPAAGKVLTSLLGEWSHDAFPEAAISDWRVRRNFYFGHGFDQLLSALPEPAFTDSLYEVNILRPELFRYDYGEDETAERNEEGKESFPEFRWKERGTEAYGVLFSLETSLRIFIHKVMTERFGRGWEKKRVSQPVYES
jgi:hypothetical protein